MPWHRRPPADALGEGSQAPAIPPGDAAPDPGPVDAPSLAGLGIAGISRRQVAWVGLTVLAAWIVLGFVGQAAEASRMTSRVADARARAAVVQARTDALRRELAMVTEERWVLQAARAYQLGSRKERPFALSPDAPPLPPDAPGSPARRLGAVVERPSPLDAWLEVLFGPAPGG